MCSQTSYICRIVLHKFTEPSMESPYWWLYSTNMVVIKQYKYLEPTLTGYLGN